MARCADTLDRLDSLLVGRRDVWVQLVFDEMGEVNLSVDKLLNERRMHQIAFSQMLTAARQAGLKATGGTPVSETPQGRGGLVDELKRRRQARESQPEGRLGT